MPPVEASDHDQRLKVLLKEFFEQFLLCFFPAWAARFDFSDLTWVDKEVFLSPPLGEKRQLDLVARLRLRPGMPPPGENCTELVALVHIEVEARDSVQAFRPRMFEYYVQLRRDSQLPVLPIGLYLRVGLDGIGWDAYEEHFWDHRLLRFEYAYVGLPALDAAQYVTGEHLLGVALSTLMRASPERRAEIHAEALKRIAKSEDNDWHRYLLAECVEAYSKLDENERQRLETLLTTEQYQDVGPFMITTYERGKIDGLAKGREEGREEGREKGLVEGRAAALREMALLQLEAKFSPISTDVIQRVAALRGEQLRQLLVDLIKAQSLKELHLED